MNAAEFLRETRGELRHVSWPTRAQAINYTVLVIAVSLLTALYLGLFDYIASFALGLLIRS